MEQVKTALVLGATGGIGGEVARLLLARGWQVKALHRAPQQSGQASDGILWIQGDAMSRDDVVRAAQGTQLIVHGVNPPAYRNWGALVLPMLDNTIAAARASGARILLPGTVYNYGADAMPQIDEDSPQHPVTRKGAIRVEMEARLQHAASEGVRSLIVRAGDFFGPKAGNTWFAQGLVKPGKPVTSITNPASRGVGHQWAYLPDVAETMVRLLEMEDRLEVFARYQMDGHWDADGTQMVAAVAHAVGRPELKASAFPWWILPVAGLFVPVFRELREMRYLWRQPIRMSNARLRAMLGSEPHTPLDTAVRNTLEGLGCIAGAAARSAATPVRAVAN